MTYWKVIVFFSILFTLTACSEYSSKASQNDTPIEIIMVPYEARYDFELPSEILEIIKSLNRNQTHEKEKRFGYTPFDKIQMFNVAGYVKYEDGWIVASGRGEWGGVVFWISKQGTYEIIRDDDLAYPIDIFIDHDKVFIAQGMNHLGFADGHVLEIARSEANFKSQTYALNFYPKSFERLGNKWIVNLHSPAGGYYAVSDLQDGMLNLRTKDSD